MTNPLSRLRYHVSGAIARGEAEPIVAQESEWTIGWRDALHGRPQNQDLLNGRFGTAYVFGFSEGQKERNARALQDLISKSR